MRLQEQDPDIYRIFAAERRRQREGVELIPSENYVSEAVLEAMGTIFTNKYSEGYPGRRYYGGNENVDEVERLAQERARRLFGVPHANVQPYSGSPANLAVYLAACQPGDPIMGQNLPDGGHLTHGWKVSVTGTYYRSLPYHVKADGFSDINVAVGLDVVRNAAVVGPGDAHLPAVREVAAVGEILPHDGVAGLAGGKIHGEIGGAAGVRLDVGVGHAEQAPGALLGQPLDLVHVFIAAVVATSGIPFRVFVGENGAHRFQHGL